MEENWRVVEEATNYEVSTHGNIRNRRNGRVLRPRLDRYGYPRLSFYNNEGKLIYRTVHRLVAGAWLSRPDGTTQVNHIDGVKMNNEVRNLEWTTTQKNIEHSFDFLLNGNTSHLDVLDLSTGETTFFRSIKNLSKTLGLAPNVVIPLLKASDRNPILGKYVVKVIREDLMFDRFNTGYFGRTVYVYDEIDETVTKYPSLAIASYHTGLRCLNNLNREDGLIRMIGYQVVFEEERIDRNVVVDKEKLRKERESYLLTSYKEKAEYYLTYNYWTKEEKRFDSLEEIAEFLDKTEPRHRKVDKKYLASPICGNVTGNGLCKGLGVKSSLNDDTPWFPYNEEVLISNRNGLPSTHVYYRVHRDGKSELALGHKGLCDLLGYVHNRSFKNFNYKKIVESLNIPNLCVERLNRPVP